jgi:two-component system, OmpR family, response regulator
LGAPVRRRSSNDSADFLTAKGEVTDCPIVDPYVFIGARKLTPGLKAMARRLRVLLVEDSKMLVERLSEALRQMPEVDLIGAADSEASAIAFARRQSIDLIILDLHLRRGTGFGLMRSLAATSLRPRIFVLTNHDLPEYKNAVLALGATHFLDKGRDYERLPALIQEMTQGFRPITAMDSVTHSGI